MADAGTSIARIETTADEVLWLEGASLRGGHGTAIRAAPRAGGTARVVVEHADGMYDFARIGTEVWVIAVDGAADGVAIERVRGGALERVMGLPAGTCDVRCPMLAVGRSIYFAGARAVHRFDLDTGTLQTVVALDVRAWSLARDGDWLVVSTRHDRRTPPAALSSISRVNLADGRTEELWRAPGELQWALGVAAIPGRVFFVRAGQWQTAGIVGIDTNDPRHATTVYAQVSPYIGAFSEHIAADERYVYWIGGALLAAEHSPERRWQEVASPRAAGAVHLDGSEVFFSLPGEIRAVPVPTRPVPEPPVGHVVRGPDYQGIVLDRGQFALSDPDVARLERTLAASLSANPRITRPPSAYTRQYVAYHDGPSRRVAIDLHCQVQPDWETRGLPQVMGGGDCYVRAVYDFDADRVVSLSVSSGR